MTASWATVMAAVSGALLCGGLWLGLTGLRRVPVDPPAPKRLQFRPRTRWGGVSRRTRMLAVAGLVVGVVIALTSGWVIAVVVLPLALAGLPALLAPASTQHIARLEAMEEWTRHLAGILTAGVGLEQALVVTLRATPDPILPEVSTLVGRLHARWPTEDALRAFADDLDDATGDLIAAKLILASDRRGPGLADVLQSLAESVATEVRARRTVEADRAKPRATVRWITLITVVAIGLLALNPAYIAPYRSPLGQAVLALLLGIDVACLVWMRLMTRTPTTPRFIGRRTHLAGEAS